ncbi:MBL fold metallo-hydrolase [soil metagenome]
MSGGTPPGSSRLDTPAEAPRYTCTLLRAGEFRLDGGSMFGLIPRAIWSRSVSADERGRIAVQHNCLLLERAGATGRDEPKRILIESGTGNKLDAKNREVFALGDRSILDALQEVGCAPESIDAAVVSHLHFDHAGGLTRLARAGETPEWVGPAQSFGAPRGDHGVVRSFPNAKVHVQRREWEDATAPGGGRSVMTRTYFADNLEPLRPQLVLHDSQHPYLPGQIIEKREEPLLPLEFRETQIAPGVFAFRVPGHTVAQQAVRFTDARGRMIVFTPDVLPTAAHVGQAYSLAYDVEPYTSSVTRGWFLREATDRGWTLCLDHEPGNPFFTVRENGKGWYELVPAEA